MEKILLIRDDSKLSEKVENYLKEQRIEYSLLYSNEKEYSNLPHIIDPKLKFIPKGETGFNFYKLLKKK